MKHNATTTNAFRSAIRTLALALGFLAVIALPSSTAHAASHTWSGAVNGNWSNAGNWSAGGAPTIGEANITFTFPGSATRTVMTNDIGALTVNAMNFSGSNYVLRGASTITIGSSLINVLCSGTSNVIESTLNLPGAFAVSVGDNRVMAFHTLTGAGFLVKFGEAAVQLRGGANNPLSGGYTVNVGALELQKAGGAIAVASQLTIVGTTNFGQYAVVRLNSSEQIAGNVNVVIHPTGLLNMTGFTNTINDITVMAGSVYNSGLLRVQGDMIFSAQDNVFPTPDVFPIIQSDVEFVGASTTVTVSNLTAEIQGSIVEYSGSTVINKTGPGTLWLKGGGNNPGAINVLAGGLRAELATSLGTAAGNTTLAPSTTLTLGAGMTTSESLILSNNCTLGIASGVVSSFGNISVSGEVTVNVPVAGNQLLLNGVISGPGGLKKIGDGELMITGNTTNTFTGASTVSKGRINLNKPANQRAIGSVTVTNGAELRLSTNDQIDNAAIVSLYSGGRFNMTNRSEAITGLNLGKGNTLDTGSGTLTLLGNVFAGVPYTTTNNGLVTLRGSLSLGGGIRRFHAPDISFWFDCVISDGSGVGGLSLAGNGGQLGFGNFHFVRTNTFNGPITADYAGLFAHNPQSFGTTNAGVFGTNNCEVILFKTNLVVTGETLTSDQLVILYATGTNVWNGPVVLTGTNSILKFNPWVVGATNTLTVSGEISGPGSLILGDNTYFAPGMMARLTQSNSYAGTTLVSVGTLAIQHPHALGSAAQGTSVSSVGSLRLELSNGATVIGESLTLHGSGGDAETPGNLTMAGSVSNNWNSPIIINGAPSRISVLNMNGTLVLNTAITGGWGLAKSGPGTLILAGNGTNDLAYLIAEFGQLRLAQTGGYALSGGLLGADVIVAGDEIKTFEGTPYYGPARVLLDKPGQLPPFVSLDLIGPYGGIFLNDQNLTIQHVSGAGGIFMDLGTLTYSNNASWDVSTFSGSIYNEIPGSTNLIKQGDGTLELHGPSYTFENDGFWYLTDSIYLHGRVFVAGGHLSVSNGLIGSLHINAGTTAATRSAPTQGADPSYQNGLRIGSLTGGGDFNFVNGAQVYLGRGNASATFDGNISGSSPAQIVKTGHGTATLTASGSSFTGNTLIEEGTLLVNGTLAGPVQVAKRPESTSATLGGTGVVGTVTVAGLGSYIAPGPTTNLFSYGRLRVGNFTLSVGSGYQCEVNGTNAGVDMDQIDASGIVSLSGGFLNLSASGPQGVSNRYDIVKSPIPVGGNFVNDPEGDFFFPGPGRLMTITYLTAGGTRVTLIEQPGASPSNIHITGITEQTNGHITLAGTGIIGGTYFIEANTNLSTTNWINIGSTMPDWNGDISFTDTNAPGFPQRFYRFRQL